MSDYVTFTGQVYSYNHADDKLSVYGIELLGITE